MGEITKIEEWTKRHSTVYNSSRGSVGSTTAALTTSNLVEKGSVMAIPEPNQRARAKQHREQNPNWRGGRSIASNGYVLLRVGVGHHLADVRGYAYEHRVVAESKIGRRLMPGELVHHIDGNKQNNAPENLEVCTGNAEHFLHHRKRGDLQLPGEANPLVACACGCGEQFPRYDDSGRPRKFVSGHNASKKMDEHVLLYLEIVPESGRAAFIADFLGESKSLIQKTLSKLRKENRVQFSKGTWFLNVP